MSKVDLILKLNVRKDERTVEPIETGGRISYLFRTLSLQFKRIFLTNLVYAAIFGLPLLFSAFVLPIILQNIVMNGKSFIGNFGIGFPNVADSLADALAQLAYYHRVILYPCIIGSVFLAFVGLSGVFYVARGIMWGETVSMRSFFRGIKKYWQRFMATGAVVTGLVAAMLYGMGWHLSLLRAGEANAGSWVLFIALILVGFAALLYIGLLLPTFVGYRFTPRQAMQNAFYLNLVSIIPSIIVSLFAVGLMLLNLIGGFVSYLLLAFLLIMGFMFYALLYTDYAHFNFDAYIGPQVDPRNPEGRREVTITKPGKAKGGQSANPYAKPDQGKRNAPPKYGRYRAKNKKGKKRR